MCSTFKDFMRIQDTKNQFPFKQTTHKKNWSLRQSNYVYQTKSIIKENEEKKPPKKYLHSQMGEKKTTYAFNYKKKKIPWVTADTTRISILKWNQKSMLSTDASYLIYFMYPPSLSFFFPFHDKHPIEFFFHIGALHI